MPRLTTQRSTGRISTAIRSVAALPQRWEQHRPHFAIRVEGFDECREIFSIGPVV